MNDRIITLGRVLLFLSVAHAALASESADLRLAVPPVAQQTRADGIIKSLFKDDYARQSASDRQALARKLLTQGLAATNDPTSQYVCYRDARDLATLANDLPAAFTAINAMSKEFAIDPKEAQKFKVHSYVAVAKQIDAPDSDAPLCELGLYELNCLIASDDYDDADRLLPSVESAAKKSKQLALVTRCLSVRGEIADLRREAQKATLAAEQVKKNPANREASLTLGRHLAFIKGNWDEALPLLANSSDATLRNLAQLELAKSSEPAMILQLADGWWAVAEKQSDVARNTIERHAGGEYIRAYPGLAGADAQRVAARIPAGMVPRTAVASGPNPIAPASVEPARADRAKPATGEITRFWFDRNTPPAGARIWRKVDADNWNETNPLGGILQFRFVSRDDPKLGAGMVMNIVTNPAIEVFIPAFAEGAGIYVRRVTDLDNQWHRMGAMHLSEPPVVAPPG